MKINGSPIPCEDIWNLDAKGKNNIGKGYTGEQFGGQQIFQLEKGEGFFGLVKEKGGQRICDGYEAKRTKEEVERPYK